MSLKSDQIEILFSVYKRHIIISSTSEQHDKRDHICFRQICSFQNKNVTCNVLRNGVGDEAGQINKHQGKGALVFPFWPTI